MSRWLAWAFCVTCWRGLVGAVLTVDDGVEWTSFASAAWGSNLAVTSYVSTLLGFYQS